tara:strand:- start:155 stop:931 length:777 start_codon:yes stop_codon:yes gene_type:complete
MLRFFRRKTLKVLKSQVIKRILNTDYVQLNQVHSHTALNLTLRHFIKNGIEINTIYDIGANVGQWTKSLMKAYPKVKFILFEANEGQKKNLQKLPFKSFFSILSDKEKEVLFFAHGDGGSGDSYFQEDTKFYEKTKPKKVKTLTLDNLVEKEKLSKPDFIKIDTQGSELDILIGAKQTLKVCKFVLLEVPIYRYNLAAPTFEQYIEHMKTIGFTANNVVEVHSHYGVLTQIDIFFVRNDILIKIEPESFKNYIFLKKE